MRAIFALGLLLIGAAPLHAQNVALLARAGTGGVGGGIVVGVHPKVNVRAEASYFNYSRDDLEIEADYETSVAAEGTLMLGSLIADWYPTGGGFRFSFGGVYNGIEGSGSILPVEPVEVGSRTYSPQQVGSVTAEITPSMTIAPYGGIGFGNALSRRIGIQMDMGAVYLGSPEVELVTTGMLTPTAQEAEQIEENLSWVQVYPIVTLGLSVRLF
jgi:hypothetical protein